MEEIQAFEQNGEQNMSQNEVQMDKLSGKEKKKLFSGQEISKMLLFLAALAVFYFPYLIKVIVLCIYKKPIPKVVCGLFGLLGFVIGILILIGIEKRYQLYEKKSWIRSLLYLIFAYLTEVAFFEKGYVLLLGQMVGRMAIYWVIYAGMVCLLAVLFAMALPKVALPKLHFWMQAGILLGMILSYELLSEILSRLLFQAKASFASVSLFYILEAVLITYLMDYFLKKRANLALKKVEKKHFLFPGIGCIIALGVCIYFSIPMSPEDLIYQEIVEELEHADLEAIIGTTDLAKKGFETATQMRKCWYAICDDPEYENVHLAESDNLQICLMHWEKEGNLNAIENYLYYQYMNLDIGKEFLLMFPEEPTEKENALQKEILMEMIASDSFSVEALTYRDIEGKKEKIRDRLDELGNFECYEKILDIISKVAKQGSVEAEDVSKVLELAKENPDNLYIQKIASDYGSSFQVDGGSHYEKTAEVLLRYLELYENKYGTSDTVFLDVIAKLSRMNDYDRVIKLIQMHGSDSMACKEYLSMSYLKQGKLDQCLEVIEEMLKEDPTNYHAYYERAYCYLEQNEIEKSIESTISLVEIMESLSGEARYDAELELYYIVQRYSANDLILGKGKIGEEEKKQIQKCEILNLYCEAVYLCFGSKEYEEALQKVDALKELVGPMPNVFFIEGNIYMGQENFEKAVEAYQKSLELDDQGAVVWYSLGNAYDALFDYENAYLACLRANEILSSTDHQNDPYGVAIHNKGLMNSLKNKIEEGK